MILGPSAYVSSIKIYYRELINKELFFRLKAGVYSLMFILSVLKPTLPEWFLERPISICKFVLILVRSGCLGFVSVFETYSRSYLKIIFVLRRVISEYYGVLRRVYLIFKIWFSLFKNCPGGKNVAYQDVYGWYTALHSLPSAITRCK